MNDIFGINVPNYYNEHVIAYAMHCLKIRWDMMNIIWSLDS